MKGFLIGFLLMATIAACMASFYFLSELRSAENELKSVVKHNQTLEYTLKELGRQLEECKNEN